MADCLKQAGLHCSDQSLETWYTQIRQALDSAQAPLSPPLTAIPQLPAAFVQNAPESVFLADPCNVWVLDFWAEHWPQARFLLLHTPVDIALARALRQGVEPEKWVSSWEQASRYLMQFQQRQRRRALLLDADAAQQYPTVMFERVQSIGLTFSVSSPLTPVDPTPYRELSLERWLASHFLADYPHLTEVQLEIEAYFHPLGEIIPPPPLDSAALLACYQQRHNAYKQQTQLANTAEEENELLLTQLHQVQEELEQYYLRYQALQKQQEPIIPKQEPQAESQTVQITSSKPKRQWRQLPKPWKSKAARRIERYKRIIADSGLFNRQWYVQHYPDVAAAGLDPVEHYLRHGVVDGRNPSLYFDTRYYVNNNPDLANSTMPPLVHYINHGQAEGRRPTP